MDISPKTFPGEINRNLLSSPMYVVTSSHCDTVVHENRYDFAHKKYPYGLQNTAIISQSTFSPHPQYFESKFFKL